MRHGRAKQTRKTLQFYERTIANFPRSGQPYHVLLDGTFIVTAMKYNIPFYDRLVRLLGCPTLHDPPVQPKSKSNHHRKTHSSPIAAKSNLIFYVCASTITELQALLERQEPATIVAAQESSTFVAIEKAIAWCQAKHNKGYELNVLDARKSNSVADNDGAGAVTSSTQSNALSPAAEDIWHHLMQAASSTNETSATEMNSESRAQRSANALPLKFKTAYYIIATQDPNLLYRCRSQRSPIPIVRFGAPKSGCVLLLDPPSHQATSTATHNERVKWFHHSNDRPSAKSSIERKDSHPVLPSKQRVIKKAKGPNPLSCKKKRTVDTLKNAGATEEPKRKRRRKGNDGLNKPATLEE